VQRHPEQSRAPGPALRHHYDHGVPSDAPQAAPEPTIGPPASHPNLPRRGTLALMFVAIVVCGGLGGGIGYGLVDTTCPSTATVAEHLLETVPGFHAHTPSCTAKLFLGAVVGTIPIAIGAGVVAMLMLRAQSEWRAHPAGRTLVAGAPPVRPPPTGGTPPHT
jgi:hypothetical protein